MLKTRCLLTFSLLTHAYMSCLVLLGLLCHPVCPDNNRVVALVRLESNLLLRLEVVLLELVDLQPSKRDISHLALVNTWLRSM